MGQNAPLRGFKTIVRLTSALWSPVFSNLLSADSLFCSPSMPSWPLFHVCIIATCSGGPPRAAGSRAARLRLTVMTFNSTCMVTLARPQ